MLFVEVSWFPCSFCWEYQSRHWCSRDNPLLSIARCWIPEWTVPAELTLAFWVPLCWPAPCSCWCSPPSSSISCPLIRNPFQTLGIMICCWVRLSHYWWLGGDFVCWFAQSTHCWSGATASWYCETGCFALISDPQTRGSCLGERCSIDATWSDPSVY